MKGLFAFCHQRFFIKSDKRNKRNDSKVSETVGRGWLFSVPVMTLTLWVVARLCRRAPREHWDWRGTTGGGDRE